MNRNRFVIESLLSYLYIHYVASLSEGHNWGSPHDPGTDPDCTSSYLMNEFAQDGSSTTHHVSHIHAVNVFLNVKQRLIA